MVKYSMAQQATDDNIIRRMRFTGYKHTLRIRTTNCFRTATMVTQNTPQCFLHTYIVCIVYKTERK
jgi:hypothetical protein